MYKLIINDGTIFTIRPDGISKVQDAFYACLSYARKWIELHGGTPIPGKPIRGDYLKHEYQPGKFIVIDWVPGVKEDKKMTNIPSYFNDIAHWIDDVYENRDRIALRRHTTQIKIEVEKLTKYIEEKTKSLDEILDAPRESYFPIKIEMGGCPSCSAGKEERIVMKPEDIPQGIPFKVLQTRVKLPRGTIVVE